MTLIDPTKYIRQATAATISGIDRGQLVRMIRSGGVDHIEIDGLPLIPMAEAQRLRDEVRSPGRKKNNG